MREKEVTERLIGEEKGKKKKDDNEGIDRDRDRKGRKLMKRKRRGGK